MPQQPLLFRGNDRSLVTTWIPATVPGNIHADLMAAGDLPDIYYGDNIKHTIWVDGYDWWLEREVTVSLETDQRALLHFDGIDYLATLWLDDTLLAYHEGSFSRHTVDLTPYLPHDGRPRAHRVAVRLWGANAWPQPEWRWWERLLIPLARLALPGKASLRPFHPRLRWLRAPVQAGWDFAPRLPAIGLWEAVRLEITGTAHVKEARIGTWRIVGNGTDAEGALSLVIDAFEQVDVGVHIAWRPHISNRAISELTVERRLEVGENQLRLPLHIPDARLWSPWEQGDSCLYDITVTLLQLIGEKPGGALAQILHTSTLRTGIRVVELEQMRLHVNGHPFFARAVNWVPCDILLGTVPRERYRQLLQMARDRGVNLIRVWGGGGRERRVFYEVCDELGLLVWQEFPFACAFLDHYPREDAFQDIVYQEARAMVGELRHHPSLALWCAGNEFSERRNRKLVHALRQIVQEEDERPFLPPSPSEMERHNWHIWHGRAPLSEFLQEETPFLSEFGLQAVPARTTLERFLPAEALWPPGDLWKLHHAELEKLRCYLPPGSMGTLDDFIHGSQAAQAVGLQMAVERMRRRKAHGAGGVAIWQWNEPWPAISWALIDYFGTSKAAAEGLRAWYHPLLLSLESEWQVGGEATRALHATLWAINDLGNDVRNCEARLFQGDRLLWAGPVSLPPYSSREITEIFLQVPDGRTPLRLELWQENLCLITNYYSLILPGPQRMGLFQRMRRALVEVVLRL